MMVAVLIAEMTAWRQKAAQLTVIVGLFVLGIPWLISGGQLLVALISVLGYVGWLAWNCGFEAWSSIKVGQWINQRRLKGLTVLAGKLLAFLLVALIHLGLMMPLFYLMIREWGIPVEACLGVLAIVLASGACITAFILLPIAADTMFRGVPGAILAAAWLISTLSYEPFKMGNPINQLGALLAGQPLRIVGPGCLAVLGLMVLALLLGSGLLKWNNHTGAIHD